MATIFISHSSEDKDFVRQLAADLRLLGHIPWLDESQIRVGDSIPRRIADGLAAADFLLLVLSESAVQSGWVKDEWEAKYWDQVNQQRTRLLPVLREDCEVPPILKPKRYADFRQSYAVGFVHLVEAIKSPLQPSALTPDTELLNRLVNSCIESLCRAASLPASPSKLRLRVFVFRSEGKELVCRYYWSQDPVTEEVGQLRFTLTETTAEKVAVVRAALRKKICRAAVRPLPDNTAGVIGDVADDLTYVLACPIFKDGTVWGTVDFDAATEAGTELLRTEDANAAIFRIAKHLELVLA